ncbi:hypothetical protein D0T25_28405 [Duganella sp. BJB488]|uniref:hypothetical protein n=1 Tax=unclassified Duganella TaxID=2636909 RepID=UPI000ED47DDD|nr:MULTISPECIES: hypothetical protein [unclassified Duganella]RFP13464.1 hypothetical protein D0T25_28405 [Duganella sp. BJB488]
MRHTSIARQVALVSYGTQFLRGHAELEDWYRHGIFFGARLQFRTPDGNALLADDFTWWLGILRRCGALRLSLHLPAEFSLDTERTILGGGYAVAVHFADRHEIWIVGRERAAWHAHPLLPDDGRHPAFPNAAHWGGELDNYWRVAERPGALEVPDTDWKQLAAAISADLDIRVPSSLVPAGPLFLPGGEPASWEKLPLFARSAAAAPAHHLLATLYAEQARLANEMNPKNENSAYQHMDEAGAVALENWGRRLDSWIIEAELRCANECRSSAILARGAPPTRLHRPVQVPPPERPPAGDAGGAESAAPAAGSGGIGTWRDRLAFAVALAAGCLFVVACAHVIVRFPWLAILVGAPYALYVHYKKRD